MRKNIAAIIFLCIIILCMFLSISGLIVKQVSDKLMPPDINSKINWEELYPFESEDAVIPVKNTAEKRSLYSYIRQKLEDYTSEYILGYSFIVGEAKKYEYIIGWNIAPVFSYNGVVKLQDGHLTAFTVSKDLTGNAEAVIDFAGYCRDKGIDFFYLNIPSKICIYEDIDLSGTFDFANQNADRFLNLLGEAGVKYYDFRKTLHDEGIKHHESFYRTDHHWKPKMGLWAAKHILEYLRNDYGLKAEPEILDSNKFEYVDYPEWFLGSYGKKITLAWTAPDEFTMIYPKFKTLLEYEVPDKDVNTSGDFRIIYDMKPVEEKDYYGKNPYGAYDHGDCALKKINNCLIQNGKRLLIIHDSFGNSVVPFLALGINEVEEIDLRHFTGSLKKYIEADKPDIIVVMYASTSISDSGNAGKTALCYFR